MHKEILTKEQVDLLPIIKLFSKDYYLVGGTAIALHIGHRYSIDFDLFTAKKVKRISIKNTLERVGIKYSVIHEAYDQLHISINTVKLTFFEFAFSIPHNISFDSLITLPSLIDLAAMKAFALGGRAKWKDYVDLYFFFKNYFTIQQISNRTKELFATMFNEKLFRQQLSFFKDINYAEKIEYINTPVDEEEIKQFLTEVALTPF